MTTNNKKLPKISVIIPTYNRHHLLYNTLNSVINQTYNNLEIIIVDDGSDTSPEPIIKEINDDRIHLYCIEHSNSNVARNYGIEKATGDYIAMLDSDDQWLENHLVECLSVIQKTGADGLYGSLILKSENYSSIMHVRGLQAGESMGDYILTMGCGAQTSTLFTTAASSKNILWDPELINHQDYDFVIRYSKQYKMVPKIKPTTMYISYEDSLSRFIHCESLKKFAERHYKDLKPDIYYNYCYGLLQHALENEQDKDYISFFRKESVRHIEILSYKSFVSICAPKTYIGSIMCKIKYSLYILCNKFPFEKI